MKNEKQKNYKEHVGPSRVMANKEKTIKMNSEMNLLRPAASLN